MLKRFGACVTLLFVLTILSATASAQSRTAFVHLFEWSWSDVAKECEDHLGPKGFAAVQVSPPQKSIIRSEWWSRYQPLSYEIAGRGGDRSAFSDMIERCKAVGVDIYVDAIINHMAALDRSFPEVPYGPNDFHNCQTDIDYNDRWSVQNCDLVGLNDLKTESEYVRQQIADYMNDMINLGVAGFRIDAAKHIPTGDIAAIKAKLVGNPYIFQEVIGADSEPVKPGEYIQNGDVTEFNFQRTMGFYFKGRGPLKDLRDLRNFAGWLPSQDAVTFVANHDDQRQKTSSTLTYKDSNEVYALGEIFSLAYPYGYPKVMSSYRFEDENQGPPANGVHSGDSCDANWVCEHRFTGVANMVEFRNATASQFTLTDWWDNGNSKIAFGRGGLGFVAINRQSDSRLTETLQTGMPEGRYCDIANGDFDNSDKSCSGPTITVTSDGTASFDVKQIGASAIHVGVKMADGPSGGQIWDNAYFRGTANSWSTNAMTFSDGLWRTSQTFGSNNPRFKVTRFQNWNVAFPAQDFLITEGAGTYDITFNDSSNQITATKQSNDTGGTVEITFQCNNGTTYSGQSVYVVGNIPELGDWNRANAEILNPDNYPTWSNTVSVPIGQSVEWKCLKRSETNPNQDVVWESGGNTSFTSNQNKATTGSF